MRRKFSKKFNATFFLVKLQSHDDDRNFKFNDFIKYEKISLLLNYYFIERINWLKIFKV